jgi:hypothetical protein
MHRVVPIKPADGIECTIYIVDTIIDPDLVAIVDSILDHDLSCPALRLLDQTFEYRPAHALGGKAAAVQNANLHDRFYPFCIRFVSSRNRRPAGNERI